MPWLRSKRWDAQLQSQERAYIWCLYSAKNVANNHKILPHASFTHRWPICRLWNPNARKWRSSGSRRAMQTSYKECDRGDQNKLKRHLDLEQFPMPLWVCFLARRKGYPWPLCILSSRLSADPDVRPRYGGCLHPHQQAYLLWTQVLLQAESLELVGTQLRAYQKVLPI